MFSLQLGLHLSFHQNCVRRHAPFGSLSLVTTALAFCLPIFPPAFVLYARDFQTRKTHDAALLVDAGRKNKAELRRIKIVTSSAMCTLPPSSPHMPVSLLVVGCRLNIYLAKERKPFSLKSLFRQASDSPF
mmetsp:Transcript_39687/g.78160  ORF Transcript_39687/g.78160 Transcript_39687/m.78160 type:complete len:131 (-) Transcript_39687:214-606(-)